MHTPQEYCPQVATDYLPRALGGSSMPITFDRSICCDLNATISREWLVTNGLGGYATGTVAGVLTRMQHGLLVASLPDTLTPQLLLAKIDEEVIFDQRTYNLGTNEYRDGTLNPSGFVYLETFHLEEGFPVFTYHLGGINGITLEKRIWMPQGRNTTYIQYRVLRTSTTDNSGYRRSGITGALDTGPGRHQEETEITQRALTLTLLPFSAYRPYNGQQKGQYNQHFNIRSYHGEEIVHENELDFGTLLPKGVAGCTIQAREGAHPYHILAVGHSESQITFIPTGVWYWNFLHRHDAAAGRPATDDFYLPGVIRATLWPDEDATLTVIVSAEELSSQALRLHQLNQCYKQSIERQQQLFQDVLQPQRFFGEGGEAVQAYHIHMLPLTTTSDFHVSGEEYLHQLLRAGDRFLIHRKLLPNQRKYDIFFDGPESAPVLLTDYLTQEYKTRDMLIALVGLTLFTERYDDALRMLRELARHFKGGMLPDRLPFPGQELTNSDYGSVDTTLWYFYALDHYLRATHNYQFLEEFYHHLVESINGYIQGTSHGIYMDPNDGLLYAHQPGKALTWMDAKVHNVPITPRAGKPVEVNALWYNALSLMHEWSQHINHRGDAPLYYQELLTKCKQNFQQRFWNARGGYLYDVVDGPNGNDAALRPNQLFTLSLRYPVLDVMYQQRVFDMVTQHLLTPYGLRTLAPGEPAYRGQMGELQDEQQCALHQGSAWTWLMGPYVDAMLAIGCSHPPQMSSSQSTYLCQEYLWRKGLQLLEPFKERLSQDLLGMTEAVFDGNTPHRAGPIITSALCSGELLRIYDTLAKVRVMHPEYVLSR